MMAVVHEYFGWFVSGLLVLVVALIIIDFTKNWK